MNTYLLKAGTRQVIGRAGENEAAAVAVDIKSWLTSYPTGTGSMLVTVPGGERTVLEAEKLADNKLLYAPLPEGLLKNPGMYVIQAIWVQNGAQVASDRYDCIVLGSQLAQTWTPHRSAPDWAEKIFIAAETVENAIDGAVQAEMRVLDAADAAEAARDAAADSATDAADSAAAAAASAAAAQAVDNSDLAVALDMVDVTGELSWTENYMINESGSLTSNDVMMYSSAVKVEPGRTYMLLFVPHIMSGQTNPLTTVRIHGYSGDDVSDDWVTQLAICTGAEQKDADGNWRDGQLLTKVFKSGGCDYIRISCRENYTDFRVRPSVVGIMEEKAQEAVEGRMVEPGMIYVTDRPSWEAGRIRWDTGTDTTATPAKIRTVGWGPASAEVIMAEDGLKLVLGLYDQYGTYIGCWNETDTPSVTSATIKEYTKINMKAVRAMFAETYPNLKYRIVALKDGEGITVADAGSVKVYMQAVPFGSVGLYEKWAVIGASSDSGHYTSPDPENPGSTYTNSPDYAHAWPEILARMMGNTVINYSYPGRTAEIFVDPDRTGEHCLNQLLEDDPAELYAICLGGNDETEHKDDDEETWDAWLGTVSDLENPSGADTFYGYYGRIVEAILAKGSWVRIVIMSPVSANKDRPTRTKMIEALQEIAAYYGVPYINWYDDPFIKSAVLIDQGYSGNHPILPMYGAKALAFERLFSECVKQNPGYFAVAKKLET